MVYITIFSDYNIETTVEASKNSQSLFICQMNSYNIKNYVLLYKFVYLALYNNFKKDRDSNYRSYWLHCITVRVPEGKN